MSWTVQSFDGSFSRTLARRFARRLTRRLRRKPRSVFPRGNVRRNKIPLGEGAVDVFIATPVVFLQASFHQGLQVHLITSDQMTCSSQRRADILKGPVVHASTAIHAVSQ